MNVIERYAPVPIALAILLAAAFAAPSVVLAAPAAKAQHAAVKQAPTTQKIVLSTGIKDGRMVFLDEKGQANPTLKANVGDTMEIRISSGEGAQHDIVFPDLNVASAKFDKGTGATTVKFKVTKAGSFEYYCTISGHRQVGMEGKFEVAGGASAAAGASAAPAPRKAAAAKAVAVDKAIPGAVSIALDPNSVPKPVGNRPQHTVKYRVETVELVGKLDDGTSFTYWTFDKKVPGPMLRVKKGDTVELTLANAKDSKMVHSIDLHAVTGPGGGAAYLQVPPGGEKTVSFKAMNPGLYVYHCATPSVAEHISAGMYGMILVEPEGGFP